ncbi:hypothetical protein G6F37_003461 [Rhizopus arrhizus]|nr:hypothetical protein G6F38_005219 [Rhizopus arrhizus]KAG1161001.1 hypothetical protein G6F37_003461 [Rhizopus arrhizus]
MLPPNSLPPNNARYKDVCLATVRDPDGVKLLVGTKVFNGLVTSSTRIDKELLPKVEPTTSNFVLNREDAGMIEIYIEEAACCRGGSTDTNDHMMQPYTVWTYCNFDSQNDEYSDGRIASKLFQDIAIRVIKYQETATVEEKKIRNLISQYGKPTGNNSLNRLLSWMGLSSIKSRMNY